MTEISTTVQKALFSYTTALALIAMQGISTSPAIAINLDTSTEANPMIFPLVTDENILDASSDSHTNDALDEERADEEAWKAKFAGSKSLLAQLAAEARAERKQGNTLPLDTIFED